MFNIGFELDLCRCITKLIFNIVIFEAFINTLKFIRYLRDKARKECDFYENMLILNSLTKNVKNMIDRDTPSPL